MANCSFAAERSFGPSVSPCRRSFDFTLLFEEAFLVMLPSCLFLVAAALRSSALYRQPSKLDKKNTLSGLKLTATTIYASIELANMILICMQNKEERTQISIATVVLSFLASLALIFLSHFEHTKSIRPSFLIGLYLCINVLLRSALVRTYWLLNPHGDLASVALSGLLLQLLMIVLESCRKQGIVAEYQNVSREEVASFLGYSLFTWLDRLFWTGYRRPLTASDLGPIDGIFKSSNMLGEFGRIQKNPKAAQLGLLGLTLGCLGSYALTPVFPRLCLTAFTFAQPFLATSLIAYFGGDGRLSDNDGYGLIGASFLIYVGIAISSGWYRALAYKNAAKVRGGIISSICDKMMRLKQEKGVESKLLTMVIGDTQRITGILVFGHEAWAAPLETGLATWLLWRQIGPSSLAVLAIALLCTASSTYISRKVGAQQQVWLAATEKRIAATRKMLSSLKAIKMVGASQRVGKVIENLRCLEFAASKSYRTLLIGTLFSSYATLALAPVVAFGAYIGAAQATKQDFNATRLFASLILINLLATPLIKVLQLIPQFGSAMGCFSRLEDFFEKEEGPHQTSFNPDRNNHFDSRILPPQNGTSHNRRDSTLAKGEPVISIRSGQFGWGDEPILRDINFEVNQGEHIAITGSVGCGKSLLLYAVLGEVKPQFGSVYVQTNRKIGYCGQLAWLENITARGNAFRGMPEDEVGSKGIVEACALQELFDSQEPGETVGSSGAKISGGERQRLALARAIALRPHILLLDDAFSGIDKTTKKTMVKHLFGSQGMVRNQNTAVIQITNDPDVTRVADKVFRIDTKGNLELISLPDNLPTDEQDLMVAELQKEESNNEDQSQPKEKKTPFATQIISDSRVYATYIGSIGRAEMTIFLASGVMFTFCLRFPSIWAMWWADASSGNSARSTAYWMGLYACLSVLPLFMIAIWIAHLLLRIVPKSGIALHSKLLNTVLHATFVILSRIDSGTLINRFNQDLMLVDFRLPIDLFNTVAGFLSCIFQVVLVSVSAVYVLSAIPVLAIVLVLIQHFYLRTSKQLRILDLEAASALHTKLSEFYTGLVTIRAHGWQHFTQEEFHEKLDVSQEPVYLLYIAQTWLQLTLNLVVAGLAVTVVGVAVALRHTTSASRIGVAFLNLVSLGETLTNLMSAWTSMETSLGAISRIERFEKDTMLEPDISSPVAVPAEWPASGRVKFDDVWTSYDSGAAKPVWSLQSISLEINPGEKVAVCGRSGSGKSTLLLSLLALVDPVRGIVSLDGVDISRVQRSLLRSRLQVISQDAYIPGETIREALDLEDRKHDEALNETLRACSLMEKINASGGLSAKVGDVNLSVGEVQLFMLARTIIEGSENGGGIDVDTEKKILTLVSEKLRGKTVISVLHRLETALQFDKILVLDNGLVAHFGSPVEVMKNSELFASFR